MKKISQNVLEELTAIASRKPSLSTTRGDLFVSEKIPASCIRLNAGTISVEEYLKYLTSWHPESERPASFNVVPVENQGFQIVVLGDIRIEDNVTTLDGKKVVLL